MSSFLNQQLTDVGWDALSVALGGGTLTFYKMQAGSGTIANDAAIPPMTALVAPVYDIGITSYVIEGDGQITLFGNISSEQVTTGFNFKELGVFAVIEDPVAGQGGTPAGANITAIQGTPSTQANPVVPPPSYGTPLMYSYANSYATSDYIPGAAESTDVVNTIQVTVKIDKATNVQINITAGQQFAVANIGAPSVGAGPWSYTQANVGYFKRLVAGAAMLVTEDTNTITIGQKQLTSDLDLYVANGNPDISPDFSTIQNALDYLGQFVIPTAIQARIHVSAGTYVSPNVIHVAHPNSQSITIQGPQLTMRTGTSVSIVGSANNWNLTVNGIPDTTEFAVNDWAIISNLQGVAVSHPLGCGFFKVLSKTASTVTVRAPNPKTSFSLAGTTVVNITPINVILTSSTLNQSVFSVGAQGLGLFQHIGVTSTVTPTLSMAAVFFGGTSTIKYIGVAGFNPPVNAQSDNIVHGIFSGASVSAYRCASTNNQNGISGAGNCNYTLEECASTYNKNHGIWIEAGNCTFVKTINFIGGNGGHGLVASTGGTMVVFASVPLAYVICHNNDLWGLYIANNGCLTFSTASCTLWLQNNGLTQAQKYDVNVVNYGLCAGSAGITGTRIFNSPVGTINSSGGLIN
jgi:hypothetical protein